MMFHKEICRQNLLPTKSSWRRLPY